MTTDYCLPDIIQQIIHTLQSHGQAECGFLYAHGRPLFGRKCAVDSTGRVNDERSVIKKVGSAADQLQPVQEAVTSLFRIQVEGQHGTRQVAELLPAHFVKTDDQTILYS